MTALRVVGTPAVRESGGPRRRPTAGRRRRFLIALAIAAALAVAACGGTDAAEPTAGARATVTVSADNGEIEVPVTTEGIWALDEHAALYLLALGVVPEHAADTFRADVSLDLLRDAGVEIVEPENLELVAAADPELIVGIPYSGHVQLAPQLERIAPVVLLPGESISSALEIAGSMTGQGAEAAAILGRIDTATDDLAARVAGSDLVGSTVSVLSGHRDTAIYAYDQTNRFGTILTRLGFERPAAQLDLGSGSTAGYAELSPERLDDHRGDVVIAMTDEPYNGGRSVLDDPLFDTSDARETATVDWLVWYSPSPLADWWIIHDLDAILFSDGTVAAPDDGPALWAEMTGAS